MASRFTETGKWRDSWFRSLDVESKLVWLWLCDNCDACGYLEWVPEVVSQDLKVEEGRIVEIISSFDRKLIWSEDRGSLVIPNFLRHQKNLPMLKSPAHLGIAKRWYAVSHKFHNCFLDSKLGIVRGIDTLSIPYPNPIDTLSIPLPYPKDTLSKGYRYPLGKGIGNGKGNSEGGVGETFEPFGFNDLGLALQQEGLKGKAKEVWDHWRGLRFQDKGYRVDLEYVIADAVKTYGSQDKPSTQGDF